MLYITQDGTSASRLTDDVIKIVGSIPEVVEGLTGVNLKGAMSKMSQADTLTHVG